MAHSFFAEYVERVLDNCGLAGLTPAQKQRHIPRITALLEERVGLELLPKLSKDEIERFMEMSDDPATTAGQWKKFWWGAIPHFEDEMARILSQFSAKAKQNLCPV